ncbi:hypothetical protein AVEN_121935-1, partial [Araneus ventricosus]
MGSTVSSRRQRQQISIHIPITTSPLAISLLKKTSAFIPLTPIPLLSHVLNQRLLFSKREKKSGMYYISLLKSFSLAILTARFEASRGLFWDGLRNFEPQLDDEDDLSWHPLSKLPHHTSSPSIPVDSKPY